MDKNRTTELAERSRAKNIFVYTDFLNEQVQGEISAAYPQSFVSFWGGADFATRKLARFGSSDVAYMEDFPLCTVKICALGGKFSSEMRHRDILGALMSLGLVREKVGDIFTGESCAYVVLHQSVAPFVLQNLTTVGSNRVSVEVVDAVDASCAPKRESRNVSAASNRLDSLVCKVFNLSREKAGELCQTQKIYVNGVVCEKASRPLKEGDSIGVRGFGKFLFCGETGISKKGKFCFAVEVFA